MKARKSSKVGDFEKGDIVEYYGRQYRVRGFSQNGYKLQSVDDEEIIYQANDLKLVLSKRTKDKYIKYIKTGKVADVLRKNYPIPSAIFKELSKEMFNDS